MPNNRGDLISLAIAILIPQAAGAIGSLPTMRAIPTWYRTLKKPSWAPPSWVFPPVWTTLYLLMGTASWLVWRLGWNRKDVRWSLGLFGGQLSLNTLWSVIFFGLRSPGLALAEIALLWNMIAATLVRFYKLRPAAGLMLVPYLLWVTFASGVNAAVWWLNRK